MTEAGTSFCICIQVVPFVKVSQSLIIEAATAASASVLHHFAMVFLNDVLRRGSTT